MKNTFLKAISLILTLCISTQTQAQTELVIAHDASFTDYKTFLKKETQFQSPISKWRKETLDQKSFQGIYADFSDAQASYLDKNQNIKLIVEKFKKLTDQAYNRDYPDPERALIFFSFLRLAQLESQLRQDWLLKAAQYDWTMKADEKVFEPELIKELSSNQKDIIKRLSPLTISHLHEGDHVYINGRKILKNTAQTILVPLDFVLRLTIVSNYESSHHYLGKLETFKPQHVLKIQKNTCDYPSEKLLQQNKAIFYSIECIVVPNKSGFKRVNYLESVQYQKSFDLTPELQPSLSIEGSLQSADETPIYKKPLFWIIAAGVLTSAVVIMSQQKEREERREATHTTGR